MATGRTIEKFIYVIVGDTANTLREINVTSINDVGLNYEAKDVTAWADAIKNMLTGQPGAPIKNDVDLVFQVRCLHVPGAGRQPINGAGQAPFAQKFE